MGTFHNDQRSGAGELYFPDSRSFDGTFKNGRFCGKGTFTEADGRRCETCWNEAGKKNGDALLTWPDGKVFRGKFENDLLSGEGEYNFPRSAPYARIQLTYLGGKPVADA